MDKNREIRARLSLSLAVNGTPSVVRRFVRTYGSGVNALNAPDLSSGLRQHLSDSSLEDRVDEQLYRADKMGARWILPHHGMFSYPLDVALLCVRGHFPDGPSLSVVGARNADTYGLQIADALSRSLATAGVTIVSGAAAGIDEAAHRAALDVDGLTVAVLGTGLDSEQNNDRKCLHDDVVDGGGCVVSEYLIGTRGSKWTFPERNRIVACWGKAVVVVQAAQRSGALITARIAQRRGIPVYAVAGDICYRSSEGTNLLIANQKARLLRHPGDLVTVLGLDELNEVFWPRLDRRDKAVVTKGMGSTPLSDNSRVLRAIATNPGQPIDYIVQCSGVLKSSIAEVLFELQMDRRIRCRTDNTYEVIQ